MFSKFCFFHHGRHSLHHYPKNPVEVVQAPRKNRRKLQELVVKAPKKNGDGAGTGTDSVSEIIKVISKQEARTMNACK